jgi:cytoskeletal protein CcmA (bactofilin family)
MLGIGSKTPPVDKIETVIGPNTNFKGRLLSDGSVRIDGVCEEGVIETVGNIVVGPEARVAADLVAVNVSVSGAVTGNIKASGRLEILSTGKVWGDVDVGSFLLDDEGYFEGKLLIGESQARPTFGSDRSETLDPETAAASDTSAGDETGHADKQAEDLSSQPG